MNDITYIVDTSNVRRPSKIHSFTLLSLSDMNDIMYIVETSNVKRSSKLHSFTLLSLSDMNDITYIVETSNVKRSSKLHSFTLLSLSDMNDIMYIVDTSNVRRSSKHQEEICSFTSEIDPLEFDDFLEVDYADRHCQKDVVINVRLSFHLAKFRYSPNLKLVTIAMTMYMPQLEQSSLQPSSDLHHRHLLQTTSYNHLLLLHLLISRKGKLKQQHARTPPTPPSLVGGCEARRAFGRSNPLQNRPQ